MRKEERRGAARFKGPTCCTEASAWFCVASASAVGSTAGSTDERAAAAASFALCGRIGQAVAAESSKLIKRSRIFQKSVAKLSRVATAPDRCSRLQRWGARCAVACLLIMRSARHDAPPTPVETRRPRGRHRHSLSRSLSTRHTYELPRRPHHQLRRAAHHAGVHRWRYIQRHSCGARCADLAAAFCNERRRNLCLRRAHLSYGRNHTAPIEHAQFSERRNFGIRWRCEPTNRHSVQLGTGLSRQSDTIAHRRRSRLRRNWHGDSALPRQATVGRCH